MFQYNMLLLIILLTINYSVKVQTAYIGAVIEHSPTAKDTPRNTILANLDYLRTKVEDAHKQSAQIVVFPEYSLTTYSFVDNLDEYAISVNDNDQVITELKSMAKEHNIYIVANILEKSTDINNNTIYYNTDLVFDKNRNIIAKYRKINLNDRESDKLTAGSTPVIFSTDFSVTFGLISGTDIFYPEIIQEILQNNVSEIICPSALSSAMPFYTSISLNHGYAQANGVNLLVASYDYPQYGYGGSGIYLADGKVAESFIDGARSTKLIVQSIRTTSELNNKYPLSCNTTVLTLMNSRRTLGLSPIITPNITNYSTRRIFDSNSYRFKSVDLSKTNQTQQVCYGDFCCTFNINIDLANTNEMYKLMTYVGNVQFDQNNKVNVKICSLLSCRSNNIDSCGERINGTTRFNSISINGNLPLNNNLTFYQPITLKYNLKSIEETKYCGSQNDKNEWQMELRTDTPQDGLLVFGVLGYNSSNFIQPLQYLIILTITIIMKCLY